MLKSVLAAMPSYDMSYFKLLQSLCTQIQSALTRFWWNSSPKNLGGLGFKDINNFNDALLAKLSWRLFNNPTFLLVRVLLGKYCLNSSFLKCTAPILFISWREKHSHRERYAEQTIRMDHGRWRVNQHMV